MKLTEAITEFDLAMRGGSIAESTRTLYHYTLRELLAHCGDIDITEITLSQLRHFRANLFERPLSLYTKHRHIRQTRHFFRWLVDEGHLSISPAARLELPKLPKNKPPKDINPIDRERMIEAADDVRDLAIVLFLAETGCRRAGLTSLRFGDIDLENHRAIVTEKGSKTRKVRFGPATAAALRAWLVVRPRDKWGDFVFVGKRGPLTGSGVYRILERLAKKGGVEGRYNPHAFRHGLARRLLQHHLDLGTVSRILGHSDIETTHSFYAVWADNELDDRYDEFGGPLDLPHRKTQEESEDSH